MAYSYVLYVGNGSTTNYTFSFPYLEASDIKVFVDGVEVSYTFLNSSTVTISPAPSLGSVIRIARQTISANPPVDFADGSVLLEQDLDLLARYNLYTVQEATDRAENSLTINIEGNIDADNRRIVNLAAGVDPEDAVNLQQLNYEYPKISTVADDITLVNIVAADLNSVVSYENDLGSITSPVTTTPLTSSSIREVAENIDDVNTVADNIADINTVADNVADIDTVVTNLAAIQAATTSASNAAASASSASTSASNASSSASSAATSATNAGNSASAAASSASAAASSASAAAGSASSALAAQTATENIFDQFGDQYLGAKSSDPTVDNDGDPLNSGDIYWNTTTNTLRFYNGTAWVAPETIATTAATNASNSASSASTSASNAATSATNASNSASSASTSASNASSSATSASNSASAAATSETNAGNSASAAATSATNAANSATLAASYVPSQTGNSGKLLTTDGTSPSWTGIGSVLSGISGSVTAGGTWTYSNTIVGSVSGNAGTVTNGVYTTGSYSDPAWIASLDGSKLSGTVVATNGVVTTGSYSNPTWITSLDGSKLSGTVTATNGVVTSGSYSNPTWLTSLDGSKLTGTVVATNGVVTTGSYSNPTWITSVDGSKLTGTVVATNGVVTTGSYTNPAWISSLDGSKLTGTVVATDGVVTTGSYSNPTWVTSLDGSKVSGTVAVANGGTGASTASSARVNLLPSYTSNGSKVLALNPGATDVEWVPAGAGTVTSVGLSVPTGLSASGSPVTSSGTISITYASGYSIPTTASQSNWDTAYGWGNHASAGYALSSSLGSLATKSAVGTSDITDASITVAKLAATLDLGTI